MVSLGIITLHPQLESTYFKEMAKRAPEYRIQVFRFHPKDWDPHTNTVTGAYYDERHDTWEFDVFPLPEFIYDRCFYSNNRSIERYYSIVKQLKEKATFLSTGLPNKWQVHLALQNDPFLSQYLPDTALLSSSEEAIEKLLHERQLVLKPDRGAQGKGIIFLKMTGSKVEVQTHIGGSTKTASYSIDRLNQWVHRILEQNQYIAQSFLELKNEENKPFDARVLVQKNRKGMWQEYGRGIRTGRIGSLVSNIHNGGKIVPFASWQSKQEPFIQKKIEKQMEEMIQKLPYVLERHFGRLYEIGIDIGIDQNGKCWLLEANSKPGHQIIVKTEREAVYKVYENPLHFCLFLASK
ncbi:hypothetical protein DCC39_14730 [Pueribacillus theae]|uniref:ATP-grasp domain-containing protein n=1 Tax=Pueribacillus theae TaxID=2171751 RepID=A0A2U1JTI6_9BACI|nr:YheC/YheD family protein [Pueribacillus theae]PWA08530.1 hypothetical protein DCC39_14730 [Pueribacillus theae]